MIQRKKRKQRVEEKKLVSIRLQEHEMKEILENELGLRTRRHTGRKGINFMICCPFHGESRPSAGILLDGYGQCFSCEERFSLPKLYAHVKGIDFEEAVSEIQEKFNVEMKSEIVGKKKLKRYDDLQEQKIEKTRRFELPRFKMAPFRSGKETHKYFFERGFTKETVKECMIGWDRVKKRVTIPVFHRDGTLCGFSGRAVLEQKLSNGKPNPKYVKTYGNQPKYYIYENFPIGEVLFGSHEFPEGEDTAIIVEGMLDRLWMRQQGFKNALGIIIAKMAIDSKTGVSAQAQILHELGVKKVIFMHDNDSAGEVGKKVAYDILKSDFMCFDTQYPEGWKDPLGDDEHPPLTVEQIEEMIENKVAYGRKKLKRI